MGQTKVNSILDTWILLKRETETERQPERERDREADREREREGGGEYEMHALHFILKQEISIEKI